MTDKLYSIDGDALRRIRLRRNWTQETLATYARVSPNLIYRLEDPENYTRKGINPWRRDKATRETLRFLARALKVETSALTAGAGEMPAPRPPEPPPAPPKRLPNWSGREHIRDRTHRLIELAAPDMDPDMDPDMEEVY